MTGTNSSGAAAWTRSTRAAASMSSSSAKVAATPGQVDDGVRAQADPHDRPLLDERRAVAAEHRAAGEGTRWVARTASSVSDGCTVAGDTSARHVPPEVSKAPRTLPTSASSACAAVTAVS